MPSWYDYLTPYGVSAANAKEAQAAFGKNLGYAPSPVEMTGFSQEFDENGNPLPKEISQPKQYMDPGKGILADPGMNPDRMRLAYDMMGINDPQAQVLASNLISNDLGNSNKIFDLDQKAAQAESTSNAISSYISGRHNNNTSPISMNQGQPNQPPIGSPIRQNPSPVAPFSPQGNTNGSPQGTPPIDAPILATGQPQQPTNISAEQAWQGYNQEMNMLSSKFGGNPNTKSFYDQQAKVIGMKYGFGDGSSSLTREWRDAQRLSGYQGNMEEYAKMKRQTIMKDAVNQAPLTSAEKIKYGLIDNAGRPVQTPYVFGKDGPKPIDLKMGDVGQQHSAAYLGMMQSFEPEIANLTPEDGYSKDILRSEFADMLNFLPMNVANSLRSGKGQMRRSVEDAWLNANGRDESGATIKEEEMDKYRNTYFVRAFDSPETIAFKKKLRDQAIAGMKLKSGSAYSSVEDTNLANYKMIASGNNMAYESHDSEYIYGTAPTGTKMRVKIKENR
jgi:hypothetical protein